MKVFISHCSTDKPFVERLAKDLHERESISCWFDKEGIGNGDSIPAKIGEALSNASIFVVVLSVEGVNSTWVNHEINTWLMLQFEEEKLAKQQSRTPNRRIAPVLYRDCQIPTLLQSFLRVSINEQNYEYGFKQLVQGIIKNPPVTPSNAMPSQSIVFNLLKDLLPFQFKTVLFYYGINESDLSENIPQSQKALEVIKLATQQDESLSNLLNTIYEVAPHLRR